LERRAHLEWAISKAVDLRAREWSDVERLSQV